MLYVIAIVCDTQYIRNMQPDALLLNQVLELRRGVIVLVALSQLQEPCYGYGLLQRLEKNGMNVDAGTLYPLMRRLEKQGILKSYWDTTETRPRKYYQLSSEGQVLYQELLTEWQRMTANIQQMTTEGQS